MRAHWDTWFTEAHMQALAQRHVEIVRLPIGDWTTVAYGPYIGLWMELQKKLIGLWTQLPSTE